jgi:hypothetical protein
MWGMLQLARRAKLAIGDFQSITRGTYRSSSILLIFEKQLRSFHFGRRYSRATAIFPN